MRVSDVRVERERPDELQDIQPEGLDRRQQQREQADPGARVVFDIDDQGSPDEVGSRHGEKRQRLDGGGPEILFAGIAGQEDDGRQRDGHFLRQHGQREAQDGQRLRGKRTAGRMDAKRGQEEQGADHVGPSGDPRDGLRVNGMRRKEQGGRERDEPVPARGGFQEKQGELEHKDGAQGMEQNVRGVKACRPQPPQREVRHVRQRDHGPVVAVLEFVVRVAEEIACEDLADKTRRANVVILDDQRPVVPDEVVVQGARVEAACGHEDQQDRQKRLLH